MKYLRAISRLVIGLLFIFSGFTKGIDPVGTGFVFAEYFKAFGFSFMTPLSIPVGMLLAAFEFMLGTAVLIGLKMRLASIASMLFMIFFTLFTLGIAIFHPVRHCGCFGDAIHLSNWATFIKNVIFTPFTIVLYWQRKQFKPIAPCLWEWGTMGAMGLLSLAVSLHCLYHLPLMDFAGFKVGNNILEATKIPEGAPVREYKTTFYYEKAGKTQAFSIDNLPDASWTYVSSKTKVTKAGTLPQIPVLDISSYKDGRYLTDSLMSVQGPLLVATLPYADKGRTKGLEKLSALSAAGAFPLAVISGSEGGSVGQLLQTQGMDVPYYFTDAKIVYTMVRANPGLMLLYDGWVVAKWSSYDIPSARDIDKILQSDWEVAMAKGRIQSHLQTELFAILLLGALALIRVLYRRYYKPQAHDKGKPKPASL